MKKELTPEQAEQNRIKYKEYRDNNREKILEQERLRRIANKNKPKILTPEQKEKRSTIAKNYREKNREKILEREHLYYTNNKELLSSKDKEFYQANKDKLKEKNRLYRQHNKDKIRQYERDKRKNDKLYQLRKNLRCAIGQIFSERQLKKSLRTEQILGCTIQKLKEHLESKFESWMNWDNYGLYNKNSFNYGWDIDHITPVTRAKTEQEIIELNHYTNLQPLCSKINRDIKRDRLDYSSFCNVNVTVS